MGIISTLKRIYRPKYLALNAAAFLAYYLLLRFLVTYQARVFIVPNLLLYYMIYPLVLTSSVLLTIAVYSIGNTRGNAARFRASGLGTATAFVGSLVVSCSCNVPILFSLVAIGISGSDIIALNNFFSGYSVELVSVFIFLNLLLSIYYLNKLSKSYSRMPRK